MNKIQSIFQTVIASLYFGAAVKGFSLMHGYLDTCTIPLYEMGSIILITSFCCAVLGLCIFFDVFFNLFSGVD